MRTTLTLDPDVALQVKEQLANSTETLKEVINSALRRGLPLRHTAPLPPFKVVPFRLELPPGVDPNKLNQYLDELEMEDYLAKCRREELAWQSEHKLDHA